MRGQRKVVGRGIVGQDQLAVRIEQIVQVHGPRRGALKIWLMADPLDVSDATKASMNGF
jgi:hypothetical protein